MVGSLQEIQQEASVTSSSSDGTFESNDFAAHTSFTFNEETHPLYQNDEVSGTPTEADAYEPSEQEVIEYCEWLGMDFATDQCLMWIAREALRAPLPENWRVYYTEDEHTAYYFNIRTGESIWDHPMDAYYKDLYMQEKASLKKRQRPKRCYSGALPIIPLSSFFSDDATEGLHIALPDTLCDPIDCRIFVHPVVLPSGRTVSRHTLIHNHWRDPFTREHVPRHRIIPNVDKRKEVEGWMMESVKSLFHDRIINATPEGMSHLIRLFPYILDKEEEVCVLAQGWVSEWFQQELKTKDEVGTETTFEKSWLKPTSWIQEHETRRLSTCNVGNEYVVYSPGPGEFFGDQHSDTNSHECIDTPQSMVSDENTLFMKIETRRSQDNKKLTRRASNAEKPVPSPLQRNQSFGKSSIHGATHGPLVSYPVRGYSRLIQTIRSLCASERCKLFHCLLSASSSHCMTILLLLLQHEPYFALNEAFQCFNVEILNMLRISPADLDQLSSRIVSSVEERPANPWMLVRFDFGNSDDVLAIRWILFLSELSFVVIAEPIHVFRMLSLSFDVIFTILRTVDSISQRGSDEITTDALHPIFPWTLAMLLMSIPGWAHSGASKWGDEDINWHFPIKWAMQCYNHRNDLTAQVLVEVVPYLSTECLAHKLLSSYRIELLQVIQYEPLRTNKEQDALSLMRTLTVLLVLHNVLTVEEVIGTVGVGVVLSWLPELISRFLHLRKGSPKIGSDAVVQLTRFIKGVSLLEAKRFFHTSTLQRILQEIRVGHIVAEELDMRMKALTIRMHCVQKRNALLNWTILARGTRVTMKRSLQLGSIPTMASAAPSMRFLGVSCGTAFQGRHQILKCENEISQEIVTQYSRISNLTRLALTRRNLQLSRLRPVTNFENDTHSAELRRKIEMAQEQVSIIVELLALIQCLSDSENQRKTPFVRPLCLNPIQPRFRSSDSSSTQNSSLGRITDCTSHCFSSGFPSDEFRFTQMCTEPYPRSSNSEAQLWVTANYVRGCERRPLVASQNSSTQTSRSQELDHRPTLQQDAITATRESESVSMNTIEGSTTFSSQQVVALPQIVRARE